MKNIIQITLALTVFLTLIFFIKNTFFKEKNCLDDYPEIIKKYNLEGKYDTARWVLYAKNSFDRMDYLIQLTPNIQKTIYEFERQGKYTTSTLKFDNEADLRNVVGSEKVVKYIECELELFQKDSVDIFQNGSIKLSLFPRKEPYEFLQKLTGGLSYTIVFKADTLARIGRDDYVEFNYPQTEIRELSNKFESYLNQNYDIAHCWLKQYYEKHKKQALTSTENSLSSPSN